ncbi:MAG: formylmethanofuran dehydrogenase subunit C [Candidatus Altiarchaeales archaeon]|nr:formylmethanofuran dehydrogenase subunit C [Candidatus Altiarchaeota archaeon]MBU4266313.1 formylmethanofuran dehydrogenase subunit C [Candidatus Altiarchaeota archaeon]MBU4341767.1 formylmethanofuran dehydrogenase subunit C [Candidatus Altiarchaeota archaeon]MBU4437649.1 formylmethanofuran dehydrogenase subunit C [Candidatus Altiarchaeota archaeon]MCG2782192.1 formylmethanofuran dehydrogenase subunit C [Candidatus Altiarchaeales archaeon]
MAEIILRAKEIPSTGLEADCISPDRFAGRSIKEIEDSEVYAGNQVEKLGKYFDVHGEKADKSTEIKIVIEGDCFRVKRIGQAMTGGEILVKGNVGMHLGSGMRGGKITVNGNADSWVGMEMKDGSIEIKGNARNFIGSAYRGNWKGMKFGEIIVHGDVGDNLGTCMLGGKISIHGNAGQFLGFRMQGGEIIVDGNSGSRAGAEMEAGRITIKGRVEEMLPSFKKEGNKYIGDLSENGKGEIYIEEG